MSIDVSRRALASLVDMGQYYTYAYKANSRP